MISVTTTHRPAAPEEATQLFELRRKSIIGLAPTGMSVSQAETWAENLTLAEMERKIREMEIWVAELNGQAVGWGAIHGDRVEGLYTDPEFAGQGIGTELLTKIEGVDATARYSNNTCGSKLECRGILSSPWL
jgi:putative acetyltransferase